MDRRERLARMVALLRAMEAEPSDAGRRFAGERAALAQQDAEALAEAVRRPVATPFLTGIDAGDRIVYDGPPPLEHVLEYIEAAAQRFSWDDPRGMHVATEERRPDERILAYLRAVTAFPRRWRIDSGGATHAARAIAYADVHAARAGGDRTAGERALDDLAGGEAAVAGLLDEARRAAALLLAADASGEAGEAADGAVREFLGTARSPAR